MEDNGKTVLGIDIGGTYIKFLVLQNGSILYRNKISTGTDAEEAAACMIAEYERLQQNCRIESVGIGSPGTVEKGMVTADNLPFRDYPLKKKLEERMDGVCFFQALKEHCGVAERVFAEYIHYLHIGLENIRNILAPECIVLAGGITEEREIILAWLKNELPSDIKVQISALGNDAGAMGAASL